MALLYAAFAFIMNSIRFTSRRTDYKVLVIFGLVGATLMAPALLRCWALRPLGFSFDILWEPKTTDADVICQNWPHRLVQPEWVSRKPDWLTNWTHAEATARGLAVLAGWLIVNGALVYIYAKVRKTPRNIAPEPKATTP